jgi:hypothetical protein
MSVRWAFLVVASLLGAGCAATPPVDSEARGLETPAPRGVVVADIGPGANLYHESFRRSGPEWKVHPCHRVLGLPCTMPSLRLTFGADYAANVRADVAIWQSYELDQPYWVEGTNLLVMTHRPWSNLEPGHGHSFHGSATAGAVNQACPECYVLVLQDSLSLDGEPVRRIAEEMPWVDLVVSTNWPDGGVDRFAQAQVGDRYSQATKALHDSGRLFVGASGNTYVVGVTPVPYPDIMLPPWVVLVGGAHSQCGAQELNSGHPMELAANFTQRLPQAENTSGALWVSGTSFAAPALAGAFGHALLRIRQAGYGPAPGALAQGAATMEGPLTDGTLTQEELRDAFHRHARWFAPAEFSPNQPVCATAIQFGGVPAPVGATPWTDLGWGYAGPDEAESAAQWILGLAAGPEPKPAEAQLWMDGLQELRTAVKG